MNKILPVVKIVSMGGYYINASIMLKAINKMRLMNQFPGQFLENKEKPPVFSSTEQNIVECVAKGFSDDKIASYLNLSTGTIRNYMAVIKKKTKQKNRTQVVIFSLVHGLISLEEIEYVGY